MKQMYCGLCNQKFAIDCKVSLIIDHLSKKHTARELAEFCFMNICYSIGED